MTRKNVEPQPTWPRDPTEIWGLGTIIGDRQPNPITEASYENRDAVSNAVDAYFADEND
jgi:hypothetical protein